MADSALYRILFAFVKKKNVACNSIFSIARGRREVAPGKWELMLIEQQRLRVSVGASKSGHARSSIVQLSVALCCLR